MIAIHGGDAEIEARRLGIPLDAILDASANIAPDPPSPAIATALAAIVADPRVLARYPDPTYASLRGVAARAYGVTPERIVVGNGSASLFAAALRVLDVREALLPVPSFSEYRKACARENVRTIPVVLDAANAYRLDPQTLRAAAAGSDVRACLFSNPNNPTGAVLASDAVESIVATLDACGIATIVDEAFVDYAPSAALAHDAYREGTIAIRSMTKFNGIPGVRVGFAIAPPRLATAMQSLLPSWSIGALDAAIAEAVLAAPHDGDAIRAGNERRRDALARELAALGLTVTPSAANFLFCDARAIFAGSAGDFRRMLLERARVLIRACDDYAGLPTGCFLRIAVLGDTENARIVAAIRSIVA